MKIKISKIIGLPLIDGWSQIVSIKQCGLLISFSVFGDNAKNIGKTIEQYIYEFCSQKQLNGQNFYKLLKDIVFISDQNSTTVEISAGFIHKNKAYFATFNGTILLKRDKKTGVLISSQNNKFMIVNGVLRPNDIYTLSTLSSKLYIGEIKYRQKAGFSIESILKTITNTVHKSKNSSLVAIAFLKINEQEQENQNKSENLLTKFINKAKSQSPIDKTKKEQKQDINDLKIKENKNIKNKQEIVKQEESLDIKDKTVSDEKNNQKIVQSDDKHLLETQNLSSNNKTPKSLEKQELLEPSEKVQQIKDQKQIKDKLPQNQENIKFDKQNKNNKDNQEISNEHKQEPVYKAFGLTLTKEKLEKLLNSAKLEREGQQTEISNKTLDQNTDQKINKNIVEIQDISTPKKQPPSFLQQTDETKNIVLKQKLIKKPKIKVNLTKLKTKIINLLKKYKKIKKKTTLSHSSRTLEKNNLQNTHVSMLHEINKKKKIKKLLIIFSIILIILGGNILYFISNQKKEINQFEQEKIDPIVKHIEDQKQQQNIYNAKKNIVDDIEKLRNLKQQSKDKKILKIIDEKIEYAKKILESLEQVKKQNLDTYLNINDLEPNFIVSIASAYNNKVAVFDKDKNMFLVIDINSKQAKKIKLKEKINIRDFVLYEDEIYILEKGISKIDLKDLNDSELDPLLVKKQGESDKNAIFIRKFSDYLYVFNPIKRNIYRYLLEEDEISDPVGWLLEKRGLNFNDINDMTIDGSIYLSDKNGSIYKFSKGKKEDFSIKNLEKPLSSNIKTFTLDNLKNLYILDKDNNRIIIIAKETSELYKEIYNDLIGSSLYIFPDTNENNIYIINGSVILTKKIK